VSEHAEEHASEPVAEQLAKAQQTATPGAAAAFARGGGGAARPSLARLAESSAVAQRVAVLTSLQHGAGNAHVQRLLRQEAEGGGAGGGGGGGAVGDEGATMSVQEEFVPEETQGMPDEDLHIAYVGPGEGEGGFTDGGQTGTAPYGGEEGGHTHAPVPRAFTDGGMTGTVVWAGGGGAGAHGNEAVGSIQSQTAPTYEAKLNAASKDADAWVKAGTGKASVTRSWVGINSGDQGNGHYVTSGAATRINNHERLHVASTKGHHDTNIKPLETRIADKTLGMGVSTTEAGAIAVLKGAIKWPESIKAFQDGDKADNTPMGPVDTGDIGTGTYPVDAGPGTVGGKNYQHRVRLKSEPNPA
jgi:hypothetical protein